MRSDSLYTLPDGLPIPPDDGACDHLRGSRLPNIALRSTNGELVSLASLGPGFTVLYCYPRTGLPDQDPPGGLAAWDSIPGMRGCTPQACSYRDHHDALRRLGARVFGISTQSHEYQLEMATRLHLPFEVLSDEGLVFAKALRLPTETVAGITVIRRLTLITKGGKIEESFYPVFPPDRDSERVIKWLTNRES